MCALLVVFSEGYVTFIVLASIKSVLLFWKSNAGKKTAGVSFNIKFCFVLFSSRPIKSQGLLIFRYIWWSMWLSILGVWLIWGSVAELARMPCWLNVTLPNFMLALLGFATWSEEMLQWSLLSRKKCLYLFSFKCKPFRWVHGMILEYYPKAFQLERCQSTPQPRMLHGSHS